MRIFFGPNQERTIMKKHLFILISIFSFLITINTNASALFSVDMDPIIVTANRHEQESQKVAGNVSVITKEQIEDSHAKSVPELLQQVQGVFIYDNGTLHSSTVDIRGFGDTAGRNVLVLVDGRRINTADSGQADLVQIPVGAIERIEIIRGGGSVLYGDNAVGGVINIITKKGEGDLSGKAGYFGGSYGSSGEQVQVSGSAKGLSYYFYNQYFDKRGYRENSDELYKDFNGRLDYEFNDQLGMGLQYGYHKDSYELPGGLNETEIIELSRRGTPTDTAGSLARTEDQYVQLNLEIDTLSGDDNLGYFVIEGTHRDRDNFELFKSIMWGDYGADREIETNGVALKYIFDREIYDRDVDFILGFDKYNHTSDILGNNNNTDDLTISKDEYGYFGNMEVELIESLFFVGGSRYHKAEFTFDERGSIPNYETKSPDESVSSAGLKYEYAKGSNVFANFQQTFRFLTPNEWYSTAFFGFPGGLNTSLEQQRGKQYEVGVKHNFNDQVVMSVTPYLMETENEIFYDPAIFSNSNYDQIRRVGVEYGAKADILSFLQDIPVPENLNKLEYFMNYTFQDPEFTEGSHDGKQVPFVPTHQVNTGLAVRLYEHYHVLTTGRYVGDRYAINDPDNLVPKAKPYFVTDLKLSYERRNLELYVAINNLLGRKYNTYESMNSTLTSRDVFPAPEQNFMGGVNIKF